MSKLLLPRGKILDLKEAFWRRSKRVDLIENAWKKRLEGVLGPGTIRYVKKERSSYSKTITYEFEYKPKNMNLPYTIHTVYDILEKGGKSEISESYSEIYIPNLNAGHFGHKGFERSAAATTSLSGAKSDIESLEKVLGATPEAEMVDDEDMPRRDLGWDYAPKIYTEVLGDGYLNFLHPPGSTGEHFSPKNYGYFSIVIGYFNKYVKLEDAPWGIDALGYDPKENKFSISPHLGYVKKLIEKLDKN